MYRIYVTVMKRRFDQGFRISYESQAALEAQILKELNIIFTLRIKLSRKIFLASMKLMFQDTKIFVNNLTNSQL